MGIEKADFVYSLRGRDSGRLFVVLEASGDWLTLADGQMRTVEKPKRKKIKHVSRCESPDCGITEKIRNGEKIQNSELRRALADYRKSLSD